MKGKKVICIVRRCISDLISLVLLSKDPTISIEMVIVESQDEKIGHFYGILDWLSSRHSRFRLCRVSESGQLPHKVNKLCDHLIPSSSRMKYTILAEAKESTISDYLDSLDKKERVTIFNFGKQYLSTATLSNTARIRLRRFFTLGGPLSHDWSSLTIDKWQVSCSLSYQQQELEDLQINCITKEGELVSSLLEYMKDDPGESILCSIFYMDYTSVNPKIKRYDDTHIVKRYNSKLLKLRIFDRLSKIVRTGGIIESKILSLDTSNYFVRLIGLIILFLVIFFATYFLLSLS